MNTKVMLYVIHIFLVFQCQGSGRVELYLNSATQLSFQYDALLGMRATVTLLLVMSVNISCAVLLLKQINRVQSHCSSHRNCGFF